MAIYTFATQLKVRFSPYSAKFFEIRKIFFQTFCKIEQKIYLSSHAIAYAVALINIIKNIILYSNCVTLVIFKRRQKLKQKTFLDPLEIKRERLFPSITKLKILIKKNLCKIKRCSDFPFEISLIGWAIPRPGGLTFFTLLFYYKLYKLSWLYFPVISTFSKYFSGFYF